MNDGTSTFIAVVALIAIMAGVVFFGGWIFMLMWNYAIVAALPGTAGNIGFWQGVVISLMLSLFITMPVASSSLNRGD